MFYTPITDTYLRLPVTYVPVYSTVIERPSTETVNLKLNNDLFHVKKELADLREELSDLRLEKETCPICSSTLSKRQSIECDESCSICYPRIRSRELENAYSRIPSPVHYCSICDDYVIDQAYPPPSPTYHRRISNSKEESQDKLSEYLSRQLDLYRLRHRYIPQQRPVWIPTAYKNDYPHRRWVTREAHFSEP